MSCFGICLGSGKKKLDISKADLKKEELLLKRENILKFKMPSEEKFNNNFSASPFRAIQNQLNKNFENSVSKKHSLIGIQKKYSLKYYQSTSPIKRMLTKQRFSKMNIDILENITKQIIDTNENDKIKNNNDVHWEKKDKIKCIFCGGANCKHENYLKHKNSVVKGLHSDYITDYIIASQRPSTILIEKYNLVQAFKDLNIGLIVNVQREGEHPYCGPNLKLEDSGYSYNPHIFLSGDIKCKISGWKDMSVPDSVNFMIDIVKDICVFIKEKKKKVIC
jgi:hypothetical protein